MLLDEMKDRVFLRVGVSVVASYSFFLCVYKHKHKMKGRTKGRRERE